MTAKPTPTMIFSGLLHEFRTKAGIDASELAGWINVLIKNPDAEIDTMKLHLVEYGHQPPSHELVKAAVTFFASSSSGSVLGD